MEALPTALVCAVLQRAGCMRYCGVSGGFVDVLRCRQWAAELDGKLGFVSGNKIIRGPLGSYMVSVELSMGNCLRKVVVKRDTDDVAPCISYMHWYGTTYYGCLLGNNTVVEPPPAPVIKSFHGCDYVLYVHRNQRIVVPIEVDVE